MNILLEKSSDGDLKALRNGLLLDLEEARLALVSLRYLILAASFLEFVERENITDSGHVILLH